MTSNFNAVIEIDAEEKTNAIFDSVNIDNKFYPENPEFPAVDAVLNLRASFARHREGWVVGIFIGTARTRVVGQSHRGRCHCLV